MDNLILTAIVVSFKLHSCVGVTRELFPSCTRLAVLLPNFLTFMVTLVLSSWKLEITKSGTKKQRAVFQVK